MTTYASVGKFGLSATAEFPLEVSCMENYQPSVWQPFLPKLFLGLIPSYRFGNRYIKIPEKFKPSPLNFIYKNLIDCNDSIDPKTCFINFLDFDAF